MAKRKTTIYVGEEILRAVHAAAARSGKRDSQIVEDDALALAYEELHASRE